MDLKTIARALGGEVNGRQVLAPGPGHSPKDRSLAIRISSDAPDGFVCSVTRVTTGANVATT
jgi:hypothetical protein